MEYKHAIVVDAAGHKLEFVLVCVEELDGTQQETVLYYEMPEGAELIYDDISMAMAMLKPRWQKKKWVETATGEELAEASPVEVATPEPSALDLMAAELTQAVAAMQLQTDKAIAELTIAVMGGVANV